jgi:hypothetical protein
MLDNLNLKFQVRDFQIIVKRLQLSVVSLNIDPDALSVLVSIVNIISRRARA